MSGKFSVSAGRSLREAYHVLAGKEFRRDAGMAVRREAGIARAVWQNFTNGNFRIGSQPAPALHYYIRPEVRPVNPDILLAEAQDAGAAGGSNNANGAPAAPPPQKTSILKWIYKAYKTVNKYRTVVNIIEGAVVTAGCGFLATVHPLTDVASWLIPFPVTNYTGIALNMLSGALVWTLGSLLSRRAEKRGSSWWKLWRGLNFSDVRKAVDGVREAAEGARGFFARKPQAGPEQMKKVDKLFGHAKSLNGSSFENLKTAQAILITAKELNAGYRFSSKYRDKLDEIIRRLSEAVIPELQGDLGLVKKAEGKTFIIEAAETETPGNQIPYGLCIGSGGMGEVYKAYDAETNAPIAIKVVKGESKDDLLRARLEAYVGKKIQSRYIAKVLASGESNGHFFIAMEFIPGQDLRAVLNENIMSGARMDPLRAVNYVIQILEGLETAHAQGVVHRDLKPANVFITEEREVKITDFGIAKDTSKGVSATLADLTRDASILGTFSYLPPEQPLFAKLDSLGMVSPAQTLEWGRRFDIYAVGVMLYEMLTNLKPFQTGDFARFSNYAFRFQHNATDLDMGKESTIIASDINRIKSEYPLNLDDINTRLHAFMRQCLSPDPRVRFQITAEALGVLREVKKRIEQSEGSRIEGAPAKESATTQALKTGEIEVVDDRAEAKTTADKAAAAEALEALKKADKAAADKAAADKAAADKAAAEKAAVVDRIIIDLKGPVGWTVVKIIATGEFSAAFELNPKDKRKLEAAIMNMRAETENDELVSRAEVAVAMLQSN